MRWWVALSLLAAFSSIAHAQTGWEISTNRSRMDDRWNVFLSRRADDIIVSWPGRVFRPVLVFRCQERRLQAYVETGSVEAGDTSLIRVRFDQQPVQRQQWANSNDSEAVFAPSGLDLLRRALAASRLVFEITPYNSRTSDVAFDLTGLRDQVQQVLEACNIQPRAVGLTAPPAARR